MKLLVIGAGGHAKVVIDAAMAAGHVVVAAVGDAGGEREILGVPVLESDAGLTADGFVVAIGDNTARQGQYEALCAAGRTPATIVHPTAVIAPSATLGAGTVAFAGVVVNASARVGANAILNTGCTIDHDCLIGDHAHVGPGANLCGGVMLGEGALMGVGSCAIPGTSVGAWAIVGAGSAVIYDLPGDTTCAGTPAKPL